MRNIDSIQPQVSVRNTAVPAIEQAGYSGKTPNPKRPKKILKIIAGVIILIVTALGTVVVSRAMSLSDRMFVGRKMSFINKIRSVLTGGSQTRLAGEDQGQINILLLGIGGEGHDGPYLTDTMILAQIRPSSGEVVITSIPRDYWANIPGFGQAKINAAFSDGYTRKRDWNEGGQTTIKTVEQLTGLPITYFAVVDFSGFEKAVNEIGGLDIKVDRTFTDYSFPNDATLGYLPPVTFTEGWEHMDGQRALIFSRSRHAAGPEGSDFARSARQQKVISAFKEKTTNLNLVSDADKINKLLSIFADHFHTNMTPGELFHIYSLAKQNNLSNILSLSLDPETNLICPYIQPESGAYTLVPCQGKDSGDIKKFFMNAFAIGKLNREKAVLWLTSSNHNTAAYENANRNLKQAGLTVWELPYNGKALGQNVFYQVNPKPATAEFVKNTLNATEVTLPPPGVKIDPTKVDIIVILGGQQAPRIQEQP